MIFLLNFLSCTEDTSFSLKNVRSLGIDLKGVLDPSDNSYHSCQTDFLRTFSGESTCFKIDYDLKVKAWPDKTSVSINYNLDPEIVNENFEFLYFTVCLREYEDHKLYLNIYNLGANFDVQKFVMWMIYKQIYPVVGKFPKDFEFRSNIPVNYLGYFKSSCQAEDSVRDLLNMCHDTLSVTDNFKDFAQVIFNYIFEVVDENSIIDYLCDIKNMLLWEGNVDSVDICLFIKRDDFLNSDYQELVEFIFKPKIDQSVSIESIVERLNAYDIYFYFPQHVRLISENGIKYHSESYFTFPLEDRIKVYLCSQEIFNTEYEKLTIKWDDETIFNESEVNLKTVRKNLLNL